MAVDPTRDGRSSEEDDLPRNTVAAFVNPFVDELPELRIGGDKPFIQLAAESLAIMFWPGEYRDMFFELNNFVHSNPREEMYAEWSRVHANTGDDNPMGNNTRTLSASRPSESRVAGGFLDDFDAAHRRALIEASGAMNDEFGAVSAVPATETVALTDENTVILPAPA